MKPEFIRLRASSEQHFGNALLRNDSTKRATPDFPATEPDDRVNGMAVRAVYIAEVNPEKSEPSGIKKLGLKKKDTPLRYATKSASAR